MEKNTTNLSIKIYINKRKGRFTFEIKRWYYLELLTPETIKLIESTKNKSTKDEKIVKMFLIWK